MVSRTLRELCSEAALTHPEADTTLAPMYRLTFALRSVGASPFARKG